MKEVIYKDDDGNVIVTIKIGGNAKENDKLFKEASQDDLWFHLQSLPSTHVWLSTDQPMKNKKLIKECAHLVKDNSKCASRVTVIYTLKKNLKKDHEKPGSVILQKSPDSLVV